MISKDKVKEYRKLKGLSQEGLSEKSGLSIRTIQRIEKGLSDGSPHTLTSIAKALDVQNEELLSIANSTNTNLSILKLMNLSALSILILPLGNIIFPAIIFWKHRTNNLINTDGRKILSFQIIWVLLTLLFLFLSPFLIPYILHFLFPEMANGLPAARTPFLMYLLSVTINIFFTIYTASRITNQKTILRFVPNIL